MVMCSLVQHWGIEDGYIPRASFKLRERGGWGGGEKQRETGNKEKQQTADRTQTVVPSVVS